LPHPIGKWNGVQPTAHGLGSVALPREDYQPILERSDQLDFGVDVAVYPNLSTSRRERLDLLALDGLQLVQEINPDLTDGAPPLLGDTRFSCNALLGNHAEAEADQHGGRENQGDEEEDYLSPVGL